MRCSARLGAHRVGARRSHQPEGPQFERTHEEPSQLVACKHFRRGEAGCVGHQLAEAVSVGRGPCQQDFAHRGWATTDNVGATSRRLSAYPSVRFQPPPHRACVLACVHGEFASCVTTDPPPCSCRLLRLGPVGKHACQELPKCSAKATCIVVHNAWQTNTTLALICCTQDGCIVC